MQNLDVGHLAIVTLVLQASARGRDRLGRGRVPEHHYCEVELVDAAVGQIAA